MKTGVLKSTRKTLIVRFKVTYDEGCFVLCADGGDSVYACSNVTKRFLPKYLFKALLKKPHYVEMTVSMEPINYTFIATLDCGGFDFAVWSPICDHVYFWSSDHSHIDKRAYFFFEVI